MIGTCVITSIGEMSPAITHNLACVSKKNHMTIVTMITVCSAIGAYSNVVSQQRDIFSLAAARFYHSPFFVFSVNVFDNFFDTPTKTFVFFSCKCIGIRLALSAACQWHAVVSLWQLSQRIHCMVSCHYSCQICATVHTVKYFPGHLFLSA